MNPIARKSWLRTRLLCDESGTRPGCSSSHQSDCSSLKEPKLTLRPGAPGRTGASGRTGGPGLREEEGPAAGPSTTTVVSEEAGGGAMGVLTVPVLGSTVLLTVPVLGGTGLLTVPVLGGTGLLSVPVLGGAEELWRRGIRSISLDTPLLREGAEPQSAPCWSSRA